MQPMPDYYRILQVHPQAEQEVIKAAYRRLMRKYHPDVLEPSQRPQAQRKVQEINAAYAVLGDPQKRAQYDAALRNFVAQSLRLLTGDTPAQRQPVQVEKRIYPGRCSKTKQSFQIIMARGKDSTGPFRVVGLTPLEGAERLKPVPGEQGNLFKRLFARIKRRRFPHERELKAESPSDQELEAMFDQSLVLDFGDIDWAGFQCPFCNGMITNANGTFATWTICGKCSRLSCVGGSKRTLAGNRVTVCPWCNSKRRITYSVRAGTKAHKFVRGILSRGQTQGQSQKSTLLETRKSKRLLSSKDKD